MRSFGMAAALALAGLSHAPVQGQTAEEQKRLDWALERGRLIFALDRAAWVASDDVQRRIPDLGGAGVRGYIVDREGNGFVTIFYAGEGDKLVAAYRAKIGSRGVVDPVVYPADKRPALSPRQARLATTLEAFRKTSIERCGRASPNATLIPPARDQDPIDIYVTAPQMRPGRIQFGGHHRVSFDPSGKELARRPFTRTCLEVPVPPAEMRKRGAMLSVNHLLDPVPNEIHVFLAMAAQMPLGVMTDGAKRTWEVTGERIKLLQDERGKSR